jgi:hypothetical protein
MELAGSIRGAHVIPMAADVDPLLELSDSMRFFGTHRRKFGQDGLAVLPKPWFRNKGEVPTMSPCPKSATALCILGLPTTTMATVVRRVASTENGTGMARRLFGQCAEVCIDPRGRIRIPEHMVGRIKVSTEVILVGQGDRFEIWEPQQYTQFAEQSSAQKTIC